MIIPRSSLLKKPIVIKIYLENLNINAAMIHVIGDIFQSTGVIIAAIVIQIYPEAKIVDPICTFVFSIIIIITTIPILCQISSIVLESTPNDIDIQDVLLSIKSIPGVSDVHDLHVWSLSKENKCLSVHVTSSDPERVLKLATRMINLKYKILHTTIQIESSNRGSNRFACELFH